MSGDVVVDAGARLCAAARANGFRGSDAYDGLHWGWPKPLVAGRRRRQAIVQLHARSPIDFRGIYGTVLEQWMGVDATPIVGGQYEQVRPYREAAVA